MAERILVVDDDLICEFLMAALVSAIISAGKPTTIGKLSPSSLRTMRSD